MYSVVRRIVYEPMICRRRCRRRRGGVAAVVRGRRANPLNAVIAPLAAWAPPPPRDLAQFSRDLLQQLVLGPPAWRYIM